MIKHNVGLMSALFATVVFGACGGTPGTLAQESMPDLRPAPTTPTVRDDADARARAAEEARAREEARRAEEDARRRAAEAERVQAIIAERVHFDFDRSVLGPEARAVLDRKVQVLQANPAYRIRVDGHCDDRGSVEYNMALGQRRALAVRNYLIDHGLNPNRFEVMSFGEERPLERQTSERAWASNRRAEFQIIGAPSDAAPRR